MIRLTDSMVQTLRREWAKVDRIDPLSNSYKQLIATLDASTPEALLMLAKADIKFISLLAVNRINRYIQSGSTQGERARRRNRSKS